MDRRVGLWIDHRKAIVVSLDGTSVSTRTLRSHAGSRVRMAGGSRSGTVYGAQDEAPESQRDRRHAQALRRYYDRVIDELEGAEAILILGPGEARTELETNLREHAPRLAARVRRVEPADKMTEPQLVARTREFFGLRVR